MRPTWASPVNTSAIAAATRSHPFKPDLVYAIVVSREGIDALHGILEGLAKPTPTILHFHDFSPNAHLGFWRALRRLRKHVVEVWGVSRSILDTVATHLPGIPTRFDPNFYLELPPDLGDEPRVFGPDIRVVMLGNLWNPALLHDVRAAWRILQAKNPTLQPIVWHCHPAGLARTRSAGFEPGPEVIPAAFLRGNDLWAALRSYDATLLPFSREQSPTTDYERYSMPSRTTELCAAGLPIVCLAGERTPIAQYLTENRIGVCAPAGDHSASAKLLETILTDPGARMTLGRAARRHAEKHFQLLPFQEWLVQRFAKVARQHG